MSTSQQLHQSPPPSPPPPPSTRYYTPHQNIIIILPFYCPLTRFRILSTISLLFLPALLYLFWPSDPDVEIARIHINRMHVHALPIITVDISLSVTLRVRNADMYSMDYTALDVAVEYRGKSLGHVRSEQGHVSALGSSYVEAEMDFNGVRVLSDIVLMLEDLAKGVVPFDTVTEVTGHIGFLFFKFPFKAKVSCEVLVNRRSQSIMRQNCGKEEPHTN